MHVRCFLVDDNERFLDVAREALERDGIEVVGVASNIADAMARVAELRADVTLVDISLGEESGFDLVDRMADAGWADRCIIILVSTYAESDFAEMIEASVAQAFLPKTELSGGAIREIVRKFGRGARDRR